MSPSFAHFCHRLATLRESIEKACRDYGRPTETVQLLPVTKTHPPEAVLWCARVGLTSVGENRVQELLEKEAIVRDLVKSENLETVAWELIGHLQSNKAKLAVRVVSRVQSVDSVKLVSVLQRLLEESGKVLPILLQINAGRDPAKFGCTLEEAPALLEAALACRNLRVDGLMTIAPLVDDPLVVEQTFARLRECRDSLSERFRVVMPDLSMGMSGDFALAIKHGSTIIRVGSALFGERYQ